tara:strand:- start:31 stop:471 length:441 start_codon:yes stop_codon:yes gene_type:complete
MTESSEKKPEPEVKAEEGAAAPKAEEKKESSTKAKVEKKVKKLSQRARKKADKRFKQNGKGRYVSIKKSENGKKNVQARAIKLARKLLGFQGRMILLGKAAEGKALLDLTRQIRKALKEDKKTDEEAEALFAGPAEKMREEFPKKE